MKITFNKIKQQYNKFIPDIQDRFQKISINLSDHLIDHVCYRAETKTDYQGLFVLLAKHSKLYSTRIHHQRNFHLFVINQPFKFDQQTIPYVEFSEPGGSDQYQTGFQHIELLTNQTWDSVSSQPKEIQELLTTSKFGDEEYLKWPDKIVVKITPIPLITKTLIGENTDIFVSK